MATQTTLAAAADELRHVAYVLGRLAQSLNDPERYHTEKAMQVAALFRIADSLDGVTMPKSPKASPAPRGHAPWQPGLVGVNGTIVKVEVRRRRA